jgi:GAF domain-containing protein
MIQTVEAGLGAGLATMPAPSEEFDQKQLRLARTKPSEKGAEPAEPNSRLTELVELSQRLASELDPVRLLELFCRSARYRMRAQCCAVASLDEDGKTLLRTFSCGLDREMAARITASPAARRLHAKVLEANSLVHVRESREEIEAECGSGEVTIHSFLGAPIGTPTRLHGFLSLLNKVGNEDFLEEDEALVRLLAAEVAIAYQNVLRLETIQGEAQERKRSEEALRSAQETAWFGLKELQ